jgi:putative ABC transport system permease protein
MHPFESVRTALEMIRAHKLRAFFTIIGTVVGVTFLIAVITLVEGMDAYMQDEFAGQIYGVNSVMVRRMPSVQIDPSGALRRDWRRRPALTFADADWIAERMETPGLVAISTGTGGRVDGPTGRSAEGVRIIGASASYFRVRSMNVAEGRVFQQQEDERGIPVAIIGVDVADALFAGTSPLGKTIRIQGFPYQVIGVLDRQGSLFGMSMDNQVIAPARSRLNGFVNQRDVVSEITFQVPDAQLLSAATVEIEGWMRIRHRLRPDQPNTFEIETAEASLSFWNRISQIMFVALPGLVGISLVVGAVVIMNIMLVSVTERTREIGLRMSLGARRRDILRQFLIEAGTLSGFGGILGIGLGAGMAAIVSAVSPLPAQLAPWSIGLALFLGIGVGMVAGAYPAYRAAKLDPIEALRHE